MNASTQLIPGMDMLTEHMRRQAECITDLKGIIEELKHENKMLKGQHLEEIQTYKETLEEHFHHYDNLKAENEKLQNYACAHEVTDTDSDEEDPLEYMVFEFVGYLKDNEGNIFYDGQAESMPMLEGDIIGSFDDIAGKIIWKSDAFRDHHVLTSKQTLAKIKALATAPV